MILPNSGKRFTFSPGVMDGVRILRTNSRFEPLNLVAADVRRL